MEVEKFNLLKNFYLKKGVRESVAEELAMSNRYCGKELKWWHMQKKEPFLEIVEEYRYPLTRMYSNDQINAMRKCLNQKDSTFGIKVKEKDTNFNQTEFSKKKQRLAAEAKVKVRESSRPRRMAAQNANIQMEL